MFDNIHFQYLYSSLPNTKQSKHKQMGQIKKYKIWSGKKTVGKNINLIVAPSIFLYEAYSESKYRFVVEKN
jgi:hypothetical protein